MSSDFPSPKDRLSNWDGYDLIRHGMQKRHFGLHERFRDEILREHAQLSTPDEIERYWANESRSYLKDQATEPRSSTAEPARPKPQALQSFQDKFARLQFFSVTLAERMEATKQDDIKAWQLENATPVESRKDQWRIFKEYGERMGGQLQGKHLQIGAADFRVEITMDTGGRPYGMLQPEISLIGKERSDARVYLNWSQILPGFHYYEMYKSAASAHLGVVANLTMVALFIESLTIHAKKLASDHRCPASGHR